MAPLTPSEHLVCRCCSQTILEWAESASTGSDSNNIIALAMTRQIKTKHSPSETTSFPTQGADAWHALKRSSSRHTNAPDCAAQLAMCLQHPDCLPVWQYSSTSCMLQPQRPSTCKYLNKLFPGSGTATAKCPCNGGLIASTIAAQNGANAVTQASLLSHAHALNQPRQAAKRPVWRRDT